MTWILKALLTRFVKRKVKKIMFKKLLKEGGAAALVLGIVQQITGVDVASADVDKLVAAAAVIMYYGPAIIDGLRARFGKKA